MKAQRTGIVLHPDPKRVLFRPFFPGNPDRAVKVIARVMALGEDECHRELLQVLRDFEGRHMRLVHYFQRRFEENKVHLATGLPVSRERQLLIGAYFTQEYSLESAALFNPSMVWHPDQSRLDAGERRFVLSLRATGEGHISSIVFRSGVIDAANQIRLDPVSRFVTSSETKLDRSFEKVLFERKLHEIGLSGTFTDAVLAMLDERFPFSALRAAVQDARRNVRLPLSDIDNVAGGILTLAESNYEVQFLEGQKLSERIIFPSGPNESRGIEDARFVQFTEKDGTVTYYATYTAYNGRVFIPQLLETRDFERFKISTLNGPAVQNKGLALFPRKIKGLYACVSRQDNENVFLMFSDNIHFWYTKQLLLKPAFPWEFVQLGNCGSPIETKAGWLVLSHGVGPMRKYSIGAFLLDRDDPSKLIGRTREPLLTPDENEREGYVPNVVYSCGGQVHGQTLVIPYAMADYASSIALVDLPALLAKLTGPGRVSG
ncbi:MAG: glycoside hydrolase family 130 protein [Planctomycetaceae bacterium]